ncbi:MAG: GIY-YIG nuclease family protein [Rhodomicrobiaceae bacterium]
MHGCVYRILCLVTGKEYVGATSLSLRQRRYNHLSEARRSIHPDYPFYNDIRKYGAENFVFKVIRYRSTKELLFESERYYISQLDTIHPYGYNRNSGGQGSTSEGGRKSQETKRKRYTPEEISERYRKGAQKRWANMTPEQRAAHMQKMHAARRAKNAKRGPFQ